VQGMMHPLLLNHIVWVKSNTTQESVPPISFDNFAEEDDNSPNDVVNFAHANGEDEDDPMEGPISIILGDFKTYYVQNARNQCVPFRPWLQSTLELLYILRKSNASLVPYDRVMAWHGSIDIIILIMMCNCKIINQQFKEASCWSMI
jgi:hypothetical protein